MRFVAFVNGGAGSVGTGADDTTQQIADAFAAAASALDLDVEVDVRDVDPPDLPDAVLAAWEQDQPDAVLVAGGDGTVNCAAGAAVDTEVVLGVLPLGTFNHFAKDLGLPTELDEAAAALVGAVRDGSIRAIDVGTVNDRTFVNNSVLGLYPDLVDVRDDLRDRHGWGKVRAVPVAAVQVLRRFPLHRLDLDGDGFQRHRVRTPLVFIGNGEFASEGAGAPERSAEAMADGILHVSIARTVSRWGLVRTSLRALLRGADAAPDLDQVEVRELTVAMHAGRAGRSRSVRVALDGEVVELTSPLRYRVRPGSLRVLAPSRGSTPAS